MNYRVAFKILVPVVLLTALVAGLVAGSDWLFGGPIGTVVSLAIIIVVMFFFIAHEARND